MESQRENIHTTAQIGKYARTLLGLLLAPTLIFSLAGPTAQTAAAAESAEPAARLQIAVKQIEILDDREGALSGEGEMELWVDVWRCSVGVPPPCYGLHDIGAGETGKMVFQQSEHFNASTGDVVTLDRVLPNGEHGFEVYPGRPYVLRFLMYEEDGFSPDDEILGEVVHILDTGEHGLGIGTHVGRAQEANGGHVGDFIVTYEIRPAFLPDLRPVNIKVGEVPGSTEKRVCMAVQNAGLMDVGAFEMTLQVDGVTPPNGRIAGGALDSGQAKDVCVQTTLPASGQHKLAAIADERQLLTEYDETNNVHQQPYAPEPPPTRADLTIGAIRLNGQVPDGTDDCKDGKNEVKAVVKNLGGAGAGRFTVWVAVDESERSFVVRSVDGLAAGQEREIRFDDVRLTPGQHVLGIYADLKEEVPESNEENNASKITVGCSDDD